MVGVVCDVPTFNFIFDNFLKFYCSGLGHPNLVRCLGANTQGTDLKIITGSNNFQLTYKYFISLYFISGF